MFKIFCLNLFCSFYNSFSDCVKSFFHITSDFDWGVFCTIFWLIVVLILFYVFYLINLYLEPFFEMRKEYIEKQEKKNKKGVKNGN